MINAYAFFDHTIGDCLYVGVTQDMDRRLKEHEASAWLAVYKAQHPASEISVIVFRENLYTRAWAHIKEKEWKTKLAPLFGNSVFDKKIRAVFEGASIHLYSKPFHEVKERISEVLSRKLMAL